MSKFLRLFPHEPVQIVFGDDHTCMIMKNGELRCWGWNAYGQLGIGNTRGDKVTLVGNVGATQITVGNRHTCAIDINNSVQCWGYNTKGQLGLGNKEKQRNVPTIVVLEGGVAATQIAAGHSHTCAIDTNNSVQCWGGYHNGQLGLGDKPTERLIPTIITLDRGVGAVQIGVGSSHSCVLDNTGSVQCWEQNIYGQNHSTQHIPTTIPLGEGVLATQLGVGKSHACALVDDIRNPLKCWGENDDRQLGVVSTLHDRNIPNNIVLPMRGVVTELKTGLNHNCIVVVDVAKDVFCWGDNGNGQLGLGTGPWNRDNNIIHRTGFINLVSAGDRYERYDNLQNPDKLINGFEINGNEE
jgi:alpha-tubulin suppressor-like RCC1 family protein